MTGTMTGNPYFPAWQHRPLRHATILWLSLFGSLNSLLLLILCSSPHSCIWLSPGSPGLPSAGSTITPLSGNLIPLGPSTCLHLSLQLRGSSCPVVYSPCFPHSQSLCHHLLHLPFALDSMRGTGENQILGSQGQGLKSEQDSVYPSPWSCTAGLIFTWAVF